MIQRLARRDGMPASAIVYKCKGWMKNNKNDINSFTLNYALFLT